MYRKNALYNLTSIVSKIKNANHHLYNNVNQYSAIINVQNYLHSSNITNNYKHAIENSSFEHDNFESKSFKHDNFESIAEKEYFTKIENNPDVFGTPKNEIAEDPDDIEERTYLEEKPLYQQKQTTTQYAKIIKALISKRKIKEAIDVLELKMLKEDRVKPENYIYNLILGACGKVGYTKKAFSLYNDMKKRALAVTPGTYTALFNSCANSPWPTTDGLDRAKHLRDIMIENRYEPNVTNYNAMIKAFGRGGDLETAFALVDEMSSKKLTIKGDTLNFLLQACISDQDTGFRHALLVWHKFIEKRIKPSLFTYNLMLRCIRDCGIGDIETTTDVIQKLIPQQKQQLIADQTQIKLLSDVNNDDKIPAITNTQLDLTPNLMAKTPHLGNVLSLMEVKKAEDRLLLVGGCAGFLQNMQENNCKPEIKTFSQLLDDIPNTKAAEANLLKLMKQNNLEPDLDFYNMLIKKRSSRFDYAGGKEVTDMIKMANLQPNLITYGVLALGCKNKKESQSLLIEMKEHNYRINIEILGAMLTQAIHHNNFPYVMDLMETCIIDGIKPSSKFLENLDTFRKKCKKISNDMENPLSQIDGFQRGYKLFKTKLKTWLNQVEIDDTANIHPWKQYRQTSDTDVRHYKDKDAQSRFKPKHTNLFKQKTTVQRNQVEMDDTANIRPWRPFRQTSNTNVRHYQDKQAQSRFKPKHNSLFKQKTTI